MKDKFVLGALAIGLLTGGCNSVESDESVAPITQAAPFSPQFRPDLGLIPFPNDLYFAGSADGTLNIPELSSNPGAAALNTIDGFSTNASIKVRFSDALDASTLVGGSTAHLFEIVIDPITKAPAGFVGALVPGVDYTVGVSTAANGSAIAEFTPLIPLNAASGYLVALTSGVQNATGADAIADTTYQNLKNAIAAGVTLDNATDEQIKQLVGAHLAILGAVGVTPDNVLVTSSFSTQANTAVLEAVAAATTAPQASAITQAFAAPGLPLSTNLINPGLPGYADVYTGTVDTPYYLSKADPFDTSWQGVGGSNLTRFNPLPVATETLSIPALITVPNSTSPFYQAFVAQTGFTPEQAGYQWPLVIFQHGITGNRTNAFGLVDAYASAGFAVISIDQPLHGITDPNNPLYIAGVERTFDINIDDDPSTIDPSGTYTINLANTAVGRDNNRQASLDLHQLAKTAPTIDINGDDTPDFDGSQMHFVGQSLGSIVGVPFLAVNTDVITGTLSVGGGGIGDLLRESPSFGPTIEAGLIAAGLTPGTSLYDDYWRNAQTVIDASDPLSYAADAAANHAILSQKVLGDTVVPNSATDRLVAAMGLPAANSLGINPGPLGAVTFTQGGHGTLLVPVPSLAATIEMQTQAVVFAGGNPLAMIPGNGQAILIQDASVVEIAP